VQPIEVKSGASGCLKSVYQRLKDFPDVMDAIVLSSAPFGKISQQRIRFLPIYQAGSIVFYVKEFYPTFLVRMQNRRIS
jgi:hypothetical protein